jgi:hypothetical protein
MASAFALDTGDIVIFPHGDAHILENGPATKSVRWRRKLRELSPRD